MKSIELTKENDLKPFDCGDTDLNGFLSDDAIAFHNKHIGKTIIVENDEETEILAYFCLLNDKITKIEASNSAWKRIKKLFPHDKHFGSYPSVKIGRLAVSLNHRKEGLGSDILCII